MRLANIVVRDVIDERLSAITMTVATVFTTTEHQLLQLRRATTDRRIFAFKVVDEQRNNHQRTASLLLRSNIDLFIMVAWCCSVGRPFVKRFALCYRSVVCPVYLSVCLSVCDVCALWLNGWADQDETWHAGRPRPWPHCVRWGPMASLPKGAQPPPIFGPYLLLPNGCMDIGFQFSQRHSR